MWLRTSVLLLAWKVKYIGGGPSTHGPQLNGCGHSIHDAN